MISINKKIKYYSAITAATAAVFPLACKKDGNKIQSNIESHVVDLTIIRSAPPGVDSIDLDGNGIFDFILFTAKDSRSYGEPFYRTVFYSMIPGNELLTEPGPGPIGYEFCTVKNTGDPIDSSSIEFNSWVLLSYERGIYKYGINGLGDKYIGYRFKTGTDTDYGWAKVYVSAGHDTLILKEYAFERNPDTGIEVGAR